MMASVRSGYDRMLVKEVSVRGASMPTPRVANSTIAAIGTRKKIPTHDEHDRPEDGEAPVPAAVHRGPPEDAVLTATTARCGAAASSTGW